MRWRKGRRSSNIDDRRGMRMSRGVKMGGGAAIIVAVAAMFLGVDPQLLTNIVGGIGGQTQSQPKQAGPRSDDTAADFVSVILADTEDTWTPVFKDAGYRYEPPKLVLYDDMVQSACGMNSAASGPFYCPGDNQVYLDLSFLNELKRLGANGDFAMAYVISHEVGHHIQNLVGTSDKVRRLQQQVGKADANALSVLTELQADCFAGVWANHAHNQRQLLERGDIEEGINAAAAIGDDRLQKQAGRRVHPDSFTHGSSEQRVYWFKRGLETGGLDQCDTYGEARG